VLKELLARAVYNELTAVLGADAMGRSTVTKSRRQRKLTSIIVDRHPEKSATIVIDQAILDALEHCPFSSIRGLTRLTCIPTTTIHLHFTQSLGFVVKHLGWVPHALTPIQKRECAILSIQLLRQLRSIEYHGWQFIITLDESWSYLSSDHEHIWVRVEEQPPERPRHIIQDPKPMVTIAWNPLGFHSTCFQQATHSESAEKPLDPSKNTRQTVRPEILIGHH
jgi:hypothetical protein